MTDNKAFEMENAAKGQEGSGNNSADAMENQTDLKKPLTKKEKRRRLVKNILFAALWVVVFEGIGAGLGIAFGTGDWYDTLNKSPLTPPGVVFSIVWPILYFMLAIYGWWNSQNLYDTPHKYLFFYFWFQMICNWMWTPVYFGWHEQVVGLVLLTVTVITVAYMVIKLAYLRDYWLSLLFLPYLVWCSFATYLNVYTIDNN